MVVLMGVTVLASCTPSFVKKGRDVLEKFTIKLHVIGSPKELLVKTPGSSRCKAVNPQDGCIAVGRGNTAAVRFQLKTSPDWYFSKIKICAGGAKTSLPCNLEVWEQLEFVAVDGAGTRRFLDQNGVIDLTQLSAGLTEFYLFNYNSAKRDFFYTLETCNDEASPKCIETDPPIENGGRR